MHQPRPPADGGSALNTGPAPQELGAARPPADCRVGAEAPLPLREEPGLTARASRPCPARPRSGSGLSVARELRTRRCPAFVRLFPGGAGTGGSQPGVGTPAARTAPESVRTPGPPKSPAPEDLAHPRALRAPQISGPLCLESSAHPGISVSPRSPWPWGSCAPGPLLPRSLAPREPAGPVQSARPSAVRGPAWGALPLAKATLGAAFASCLLPAPRPPPEPLPGLLPRLSSGSKRSKKLDAIDCALRGPKDSENVKKPLPSRLRRRE
ncbi:basic proline-rich protein-like [Dama dama]|uniref:basic proline-rich protein-like n=1 Tax=Dama dama TaxID=30532 RepID=UPI002A365B5F|nr:basic proline-rich protein-like [Dama dama]